MDVGNAIFEFISGCLVWVNIRHLLRARIVVGMHWAHTAYTTAWCIYSMLFFAFLQQWWSFAAGVWLFASYATWLVLLLRFCRGSRP